MNESLFCRRISELSDLTGEEIVRLMCECYQDNSENERRAWQMSLPSLISVVNDAGLGNLYLAAEYQLPTGGRIDAVLLGDDDQGNHNLLVVELKQWSREGVEYCDQRGYPVIFVNRSEGGYQTRHPEKQTREYVQALTRNHSNVVNGKIKVKGCQYLHNFLSSEKSFFSQGLFSDVDNSRMFFKGEEKEFSIFLRQLFSPSCDAKDASDLFLNGNYFMTSMDMEIINEITESPDNIPLWSEQTRIMDCVMGFLESQAAGTLRTKHMIVISGAAGTGKTIVGFRILAEYWRLHPVSADDGMKCKYMLPKSRTIKMVLEGLSAKGKGIVPVFMGSDNSKLDLLVIDEAHRITDSQLAENVIKSADIVFVLQDDRQRVRANEIGSVEEYRDIAKKIGYEFAQFKLKNQKRSGSGSFVDRLDKLLYNTEFEKDEELGIKIQVFDRIADFETCMNKYHKKSSSAKYYASYCWEWKSKSRPNEMDIMIEDVDGYRFEKQWNPYDNQFEWYVDSIDKVGCVYTAQGLGFDYVGFLWWDDLLWRKDHWECHIEKVSKFDYQLRESLNGKTEKSVEADTLLKNIYRVMLTRAKKGLFLWFKDDETKQHFIDICLH